MLLRTRISLLVILIFVIVCFGLIFASLKREELINEQYSDTLINDRATLWEKLIEAQILSMEDKAWIVTENSALIQSMQVTDPVLILKHSETISRAIIQEQKLADRFEVIYPDGSLAFSSEIAVFQNPIISAEVAQKSMQERSRVRGLGNDRQRNIGAVIGLPLQADDGTVVGMGVYSTDISEIIREMERTTRASILIVNRRGRLLSGSADALWADIKEIVNVNDINTLQTIKSKGRVYSVAVLPQEAKLGSLVGRLISIRDVTEIYRQQQQISQITIGIVIGFLILVLIALSYYLSRFFLPLTEGVNVLNALSRGDLQFQIQNVGSRDEVGRIASAVNIFRSNLIEFDRYRRSLERQRRRRERFIRKEMSNLADTLDDDARDTMLDELHQIDNLVQIQSELSEQEGMSLTDSSPTEVEDSGGLGMMALAFKKMSARVQNQNQSLRESLTTKNAFTALQSELDIAARVQLSFLPNPLPPTETFDVTGIMKPAKEVGGDFFDFFRIDNYRTGFVVADVSGKGIPAALFMVMARTFLQSTAKHVDSPGQVLENLNIFLERNNDEQLFITVFYGILDERTGRFTYANGGHNSPVLTDSEDIRPLESTEGVLLGMFDDIEFNETYVDLEPDARLVLFTDGVTEAFNANNEAFGDNRLLHVIHSLPEQDSSKDVESIVGAVDAFASDAPQFDDITCVVLRFKGFAEESEPSVSPEGEYAEGEYAEGEYAEGEYAEGEYAEGEYAEGEYAEGEYAEGEYAEGEYAEGEYAEGEYAEGEYAEGEYAEGEYAEGEYTEGEYAEGEYAEEKTSIGGTPPSDH